jgi:hypothetical protein
MFLNPVDNHSLLSTEVREHFVQAVYIPVSNLHCTYSFCSQIFSILSRHQRPTLKFIFMSLFRGRFELSGSP